MARQMLSWVACSDSEWDGEGREGEKPWGVLGSLPWIRRV